MNNKKQDHLEDQEELNINADENLSGTEHLTEPMEESQSDSLEIELAESKDKYMRLAAEFDNYRKRTTNERSDLLKTAGKDVIVDMLDVLDDMDRATKELATSDDKQLIEGVSLVFTKFKNILKSKGLQPMDALGKEFDPELYEAITEVPAGADMQGKVVDEITKGYYLNDKIIRHAKVVVGK